MTKFEPAFIPSGKREIDGNTYMGDGKGGWQPLETIKSQHIAEDELVRKIFGHAKALSAQIARFKGHTFEDIGGFEALLAEEYGAKVGGRKGNMTLSTVDTLFRIEVRVSDRIEFGPELQTAKALFDECLNEWASDARPELRGLVTDAFNTDKEGQINRSLIFMLLRVESDDPRFKSGQDAIRDAIRVVGTKIYYRFLEKAAHDAAYVTVTIDLAKA